MYKKWVKIQKLQKSIQNYETPYVCFTLRQLYLQLFKTLR